MKFFILLILVSILIWKILDDIHTWKLNRERDEFYGTLDFLIQDRGYIFQIKDEALLKMEMAARYDMVDRMHYIACKNVELQQDFNTFIIQEEAALRRFKHYTEASDAQSEM